MNIFTAWVLEHIREGDFVDPRKLNPRLDRGEWRFFVDQNANFCYLKYGKNVREPLKFAFF